jgi:hypothetical protein
VVTVATPRRNVGLLATGVTLAGAVLGGCALPSQSPTTTGPSQSTNPSSTSNTQTGMSASPGSSTQDSQSGGGSSKPAASSQPAHTDPSTRCHTSMLSATLQYAGAGAGQRGALLTVRNTSGQTCTLFGYAGLQLLGANGAPVPTNLERNADPAPKLMRLAPGASATADITYSGMNSDDEPGTGNCEPQPANVLVTPPDERDPLTASWGRMSPVCQHGGMRINAFHQPTGDPLPQPPQ